MSDEANDLEARKNELFATITLLAGAKRDIVAARGARRLVLIERQAQLEADKERLSHEVNAQYMYRNLQAFMNRVDNYDAARRKGEEETHSGIAALSVQFQTLAETVDGLQSQMRESQEDRRAIHQELAAVKDQLTTYIAGSKRGELEVLQERVNNFETKIAADIQMRLERDDNRISELESNRAELQAIRDELREARELLSQLAARLGDALPTEEDQELSTKLRAERT